MLTALSRTSVSEKKAARGLGPKERKRHEY